MMYTSDLEQSSRQTFSHNAGWGATNGNAASSKKEAAGGDKSDAQLEASYRVVLLIQVRGRQEQRGLPR
jgi:hypothetical protein